MEPEGRSWHDVASVLVGLVTGLERVSGIGPQMYHAYPGCMEAREAACEAECEYSALSASAPNLRAGLVA
jgi:hypothetical protein